MLIIRLESPLFFFEIALLSVDGLLRLPVSAMATGGTWADEAWLTDAGAAAVTCAAGTGSAAWTAATCAANKHASFVVAETGSDNMAVVVSAPAGAGGYVWAAVATVPDEGAVKKKETKNGVIFLNNIFG